jgi:hypothetical protein
MFQPSDSHTSNSNLGVNSQPSTSRFNISDSSSESNLGHANLVEIRSFPNPAAVGRPKVGAGLFDTPVKTAFEAEVEAHAKPVK